MSDGIAPFRVISNWEVYLCIGASAAVYFLLGAFDHRGLDIACGAIVGVLISCMGTCWPLRRLHWFWMIAAVLTVLHLIALFVIDWSAARSWTGLTIMPFMAADTFVTLSVIYVVFRLIYGPPQQLFAPDVSSAQGYADRGDF
jgi:hypothetical protein